MDFTRAAPFVLSAVSRRLPARAPQPNACVALQLRIKDALWGSLGTPQLPASILDMPADQALYEGLGTRKRPPPWYTFWKPYSPYTVEDLLLAAGMAAHELPVFVLSPVPGLVQEFRSRHKALETQYLDVNDVLPGIWDEDGEGCEANPSGALCSPVMRTWAEMTLAATCAMFVPSRHTTVADTIENMRRGSITQHSLQQASFNLGLATSIDSLASLLQRHSPT